MQRWPGGDERSPPCPFLAVEGERFACGVYAYRPSCCRSFPVFRMAEADGELKFYLQEVSCPAAETDRAYTVAQWITHEGLAPYHRENDRFVTPGDDPDASQGGAAGTVSPASGWAVVRLLP